jgi:hypothetical protein
MAGTDESVPAGREGATVARRIELVLPKRRLVAEADLLDDEAPTICEALWQRLPLTAETIHAMVSGCELYILFPWEGEAPPRENDTLATDAGDLFFYYSPWYSPGAASVGEIAIYYDRDAVPTGGDGPMAGTLCATIVTNRRAFADACEAIWREGAETLIVRRGEGAS